MYPVYSPIIYGPIDSRRLGKSLGVNLLPLYQRICNFDCVYCECGKSKIELDGLNNRTGFLSPKDVYNEIERCFKMHAELNTKINYITFAGNGEPTLYPWFEEAVEIMLELRKKYLKNIPTAIFTNATLLADLKVVKSLYKFNRRFLKLDASDEKAYLRINKPLADISLADIVSELSLLDDIEISTAIVGGIVSNIESVKNENFVLISKRINPTRLFIYAIDRPSSYRGVIKVSHNTLKRIGYFLRNYLDIPIAILKSKMQRPSWVQEAYSNLNNIFPRVYSTLNE